MHKRQFFHAIALAVSGLIASNSIAQGNTFKIGLILPMTGQQATTGRQIEAAARLYMAQNGDTVAGKKIEQAKQALRFCVENLNENDRFEVIRFSTEAETLFGSLQDALKANRKRAEDFVGALKPIGGTAIDDALAKALSLKKTEEAKGPNGTSFICHFPDRRATHRGRDGRKTDPGECFQGRGPRASFLLRDWHRCEHSSIG